MGIFLGGIEGSERWNDSEGGTYINTVYKKPTKIQLEKKRQAVFKMCKDTANAIVASLN